MSEYEWPTSVSQPTRLAPGEIRLVTKASGGQSLQDMEPADQLKAAVFVGLLRDWRAHHSGEIPDPGEVWEKAEWTEVEVSPNQGGLVPPMNAAG